jgi:GTPase
MGISVVSIVGRPNVGKSTLFNRFIKERKSLVEDTPGVTRDRIYGECEWDSNKFIVIDTGGLDTASEEAMKKSIASQVKTAIGESDVIIILCDAKDGLLPEDREVVRYMRGVGKPFIVAINKVDGPKQRLNASEFYELGVDYIHMVSAVHGREIADLLDSIVELLPETGKDSEGTKLEGIRLTFLGRPNSGKSSMINQILSTNRLLVDDVAGTTVDSVEVPFEVEGEKFVLVDTAGMRKKKNVKETVERLATFHSVKAVEDSDIVILMVDSNRGIEDQEAKLASLAEQKGKALIVMFNKWDLVRGEKRIKELYQEFNDNLRFVLWAKTVRASAKTGKGIIRMFKEVADSYANWSKRITTGELNRFLEEILKIHPPPYISGKGLKFYYITQPRTQPPLFVAHVNRPGKVPTSYKRYLLNKIRDEFQFIGTPVKLVFKASHNQEKK